MIIPNTINDYRNKLLLILQIIISSDPDSNYIATIHRHRSNSKVYMAKKGGQGLLDDSIDMNMFSHDDEDVDSSELNLPGVTKARFVTSYTPRILSNPIDPAVL